MSGELSLVDGNTVVALYGPIRLTIQAWSAKGLDVDLAVEAGKFSFTLLPRLMPARDLFRRDRMAEWRGSNTHGEPLLNKMVRATRLAEHKDLGPMATVAGTVAETVALHLRDNGATKVIVENGGDLAVWLAPGERASIGVRLGVKSERVSHRFVLSGEKRDLWGVCSSGMGGRSLARGIADAAMCIAASTPVADAVATAMGNACWVDSPAIRQAPAESLRPDTDIAGLLVTESVGELTADEVSAAISNSLAYANYLVGKNVILGGLTALRGKMGVTDGFADLIGEVEAIETA